MITMTSPDYLCNSVCAVFPVYYDLGSFTLNVTARQRIVSRPAKR